MNKPKGGTEDLASAPDRTSVRSTGLDRDVPVKAKSGAQSEKKEMEEAGDNVPTTDYGVPRTGTFGRSKATCKHDSPGPPLLQQDERDSSDDNDAESDDEASQSPAPHRRPAGEGYMTTDSEGDTAKFDLLRTLRHYRRRRASRRTPSSSSSSSSGCSCESCISPSDDSFFGSEEGPPGGENTAPRRAAIWLESIKYMWGLLVFGLLAVSIVFTVAASILVKSDPAAPMGWNMLYWTVPFLGVTVVVILVWRTTWHLLQRRGYCKGDHIIDRRNIIRDAQRKELVYTVRGAIYAPTRPNPRSRHRPPLYEVVAYESEFDSETYFDSDLESDGQYRRSLTPWREVEDPQKRERRNVYTKRAWFRDVPLVWWELMSQPPRDL